MSEFYFNCNKQKINNVDQINSNILARILSDGNADVLISPRPRSTLFTRPLENIIPSPPCEEPIIKYNTNTYNSFLPATTNGPWSRYSANINTESILKNQVYALQNHPQANYIPNSNSEMYNNIMAKNYIDDINMNNLDNKNNSTSCSLPTNLGNKLFNNPTRQQIKEN